MVPWALPSFLMNKVMVERIYTRQSELYWTFSNMTVANFSSECICTKHNLLFKFFGSQSQSDIVYVRLLIPLS